MLIPQVVGILQAKCKEVGHAGAVQVDVTVLKAAVDGLQENQALTQQNEQLQEQMSMKPSVARKLAEKIKKLEDELEVTRDASRVKELERKVQKLELDLKQSYSTKNFTLKKGLLDLEKQYHTHIYGHPDMKELWQEVMILLVEEKDRDKDRPPLDGFTAPSATKRSHPGGRSMRMDASTPPNESMPGSPLMPDSRGSGSIMSLGKEGVQQGAVQRTVEHIQEVHGKDAPLSLHYPTAGPQSANVTPRHQRSGSAASIPGMFGTLSTDDAVQKAQQDMAASLEALRGMFLQPGAPVFPKDMTTTSTTPATSDITSYALQDPTPANAELEALNLSVEKLLELWSQRVGAGVGSWWLGSGSGSGAGGHKRGKSGGGAHVDASYFDTQAEAVLASLTSLREKFQGGGLPLLAGGQQRQSASGEKSGATADTGYFDQTVDALAASIAHLRALWAAQAGKGGASYTPHGLPPLPARGIGGTPTATTGATPDRTQDDLRRLLLAPSFNPFTPQISVKDLMSHFMDFMRGGGWRPDGRGGRWGGAAGAAADGADVGLGDNVDNGAPDGGVVTASIPDVMQQFAEYLREVGRPDLAVALALASAPQDVRPSMGMGGASGIRSAPGTIAGSAGVAGTDAPSWLPLLPALRLSTTAAAGGVPTVPASTLLDAALAPEGAPSWWTASLEAAARQGDSAVATTITDASHTQSVGRVGDEQRVDGTDVGAHNTSSATTAADGKGAAPQGDGAEVTSTVNGSVGAAAVTDDSQVKDAADAAGTTAAPGGGTRGGNVSVPVHSMGAAGSTGAPAPAPAAAGTSAISQPPLPPPPAPFNPLLLPGPARTMQAVMAYVRSKHQDFLARNPEAEVLLAEALSAAAELQAVQDRSLIRMAVGKRGVRLGASPLGVGGSGSGRNNSPTAATTSGAGDLTTAFGAAAGATGVLDGASGGHAHGDLDSQLSMSGVNVHAGKAEGGVVSGGGGDDFAPDARSMSFAFPSMSGGGSGADGAGGAPGQSGSAAGQGLPTAVTLSGSTSEIEPADDAGAQAQGGVVRQDGSDQPQDEDVNLNLNVTSVDLTVDDYAAELAEVRAIAGRHAEHAAALQELLARVATQHAAAMERADELEMRVAIGDREADLLREEVDMLTRLLVDVKMAYAERDMEAQRLAQRLKRSLAVENAARDELEELRHKLAVVGEDMVVMDTDFSDMMQAALTGLGGDAVVHAGPSSGADAGPGSTHGDGVSIAGHPQLRVKTTEDKIDP